MIRRVGNSIVDLVGGLVLVVLILVDGARLDWLVVGCLISNGGCWLVVALVLVVSWWVRLIGGLVVCCKVGVVRWVVTSVVRLVVALALVVSWWVRLIEGLVVCCKVGVVRWVVTSTSVVRLVVALVLVVYCRVCVVRLGGFFILKQPNVLHCDVSLFNVGNMSVL